MPEAMATTKRKFYKALDSLQNPPATATRPTEPAAKRVRRSTSTTSTVSRNASAPNTNNVKGDGTARPPPNFSPWSHETFLARLKTFSSVSLWHPKPEAISEVEWAKRGWVCVDVNTVACRGGCEKRLVVSLAFAERTSIEQRVDEAGEVHDEQDGVEDDGSAMEDALVERYRALVVDGHADTCLWRKAGCKDDISRLQVVRPTVWQPELRKRYQSLHQICDAIRDVKLKALPHDTTSSLPTERLLADLPADVLGPPGEEQPTPEDSLKALEIALHGWRGSEDSGNELLHCDACFQRVGLWMYQPDYKPAHSSSDDDGGDSATIDLVEMHREHCPWRNAGTQKSAGSLSGLNACYILQRVVSTCAREQRRRSEEQQKGGQVADDDVEQGEEGETPVSPAPSREDVERQDKERESRLKKLKSLFTMKRKSAKPVIATAAR
ncbi:hypothetical protein LTR36_006320 [Oleoguttula mirabilis]|uniref:Zf-C3HC-domain-containing protein n=1 Tax=Oleoguttula mirabilis TaxID=1507867 RepID=A0AAV9JUU1_9PEZI|nr:hypothetical protein LTR36_006320 [Oleoguttula mirabilis]